MTTTVSTRIEPFQGLDEEDLSCDCNRITAEIKVDNEVVWSKSVETNDSIESVRGARDQLAWEAIEHAEANYGYVSGKWEADLYGAIISLAVTV